MDVLKDKQYGVFDYNPCRYTGVPYYYNTQDEKYIYGLGSNMKKDLPWVAHKVKQEDSLDSIALTYYNNPTYWWVIAYFNDIQDSLVHLIDYYDIIKIPNISSIEFGAER